MKFWDTSALVPLIVEEAPSRACRDLLRADPTQIVWCLARTEALSALWRRHRDGGLDRDEVVRAESRLERLVGRASEVADVAAVREAAERALRVHPLRAADALQLGAALVAFDHRPGGRAFVSLDDALVAAAGREGFAALRPGGG